VAISDPTDAFHGSAVAQRGNPTARRIILGARLRRLREAAEISPRRPATPSVVLSRRSAASSSAGSVSHRVT
jgi:hypothetical protein